jgi:radical SAM-linked protein
VIPPPEPVPDTTVSPPLALDPRQRWRVTFGRAASIGDEIPSGRDYIGRWEEALLSSGLPLLLLASGRPRIALGAPLPTGCAAEAELLELWLTELRPAWAVREGIEPGLPPGHRLAVLESIWLGAPALSGQIAAADYEVRLDGDVGAAELQAAADRILATRTLPRDRLKGGVVKTYDLRPLIVGLQGLEAGAPAVRMRTRIHPELGTGRPDEVVAALADALGRPLQISSTIRRRLLLVDELRD